jgi:hypothetical protein
MTPCKFVDSDAEGQKTDNELPKERSTTTNLLYEHLKLLQQNMDKYDNMGSTIRNWTITLWSGTLIAGLIQKVEGSLLWILVLVSIVIPFVMGIYDEIFKQFRNEYKDKRNTLIEKLQEEDYKMVYLQFPKQKKGWDLIGSAIVSFFNVSFPHVNFIYWLLILVSLLIAFIFRTMPTSITK